MLAVLLRLALSFDVRDPDESPWLVNLVAERAIGDVASVAFTIENVLDAEWNEAQGNPLTALVTLDVRF